MVDLRTEYEVDPWAESLLQQCADNTIGVHLSPEPALSEDAVVSHSSSDLAGGKVPQEVGCKADLLVHAVGILEGEDPSSGNLQRGGR